MCRTPRVFVLFLAALLFGLGADGGLAASTNQIVYSDSLQNGWENYSYATNNVANPSPVHSGTDSISVTCGGYQAAYFHHPAFDSTYFTNLIFWLNGGASGGQVLTVYATLNGTFQTGVALPALTANTWREFTVSLTDLGVANQGDMDGFEIFNGNNFNLPTFYLDDITLIGGPPPGPNPTNAITVDFAANRHPISPLIYGTAFAASNQLADLNFTINRSGGNEESTYNWQVNTHGKGADYYFESYPDASAVPGQSADSVVADSRAAGAQPAITIPMMSWSPKLGANRAILPSYSIAKYGPQTGNDPYFPDAGNGVSSTNGNMLITNNNPNDAYVPVNSTYQRAYVQHLTNTWGLSTTGGVRYYIMDNEHSLWQSTHQDIHPVGPTMQEIRGKILDYAAMVKSIDPSALVLGPEEWGWPGYFYSGFDQQWANAHGDYNPADYPDRAANGGMDYMPWLLGQIYQHDTNTGQRLLDYFTLHCYPQENNVYGDAVDTTTELLRNTTTRQFWDSNYVDPSYIDSVIMLIPRMKNWVAASYPGTKIGVTEYNWGAESAINGGTAQADLLGIFGREGLDLATRWETPAAATPAYLAMKIYRNYDGSNSTFGDTSVFAGGPNPDNVAVFAAQRASDGALTIMVAAKYLAGAAPVNITLTNFTAAGAAQVWQFSSTNSAAITRQADLSIASGLLSAILPSPSVTLFVIPSLPLTLSGLQLSGASLSFTALSNPHQNAVLQSSADLLNWSNLATNTANATGVIQITTPVTAGAREKFFRLALP